MNSTNLQADKVFDIDSLRLGRPSPENLDRARDYLTYTLKDEYFEKVDVICSGNPSLAKYKGIIKHDIFRQLSTIVSRITMDAMKNVEDFKTYISSEISALKGIFKIINIAFENPHAMFNIEDLKNSIFINSFEVINNAPNLTFDLAVIFSIRTLLLNAKTEVKNNAQVRLEINDSGLETLFIIADNSSTIWPLEYLKIWKEKYQDGFEHKDVVTEIVTGGAGLVAYTSGQRAAQFSINKSSLIDYKNAEYDDFKYTQLIFPHSENQEDILS